MNIEVDVISTIAQIARQSCEVQRLRCSGHQMHETQRAEVVISLRCASVESACNRTGTGTYLQCAEAQNICVASLGGKSTDRGDARKSRRATIGVTSQSATTSPMLGTIHPLVAAQVT
jgi:hypothetical protein